MKITPKQYAKALIESSNSEDLSKIAEVFWFKLQKDNSYNLFSEIIDKLEEAYAEKEGKILVKVYSPASLSYEQEKKIADQIKSKYKKSAYIINIVEPSLEIGYRIETEDEVFDNSFRGKINKLKTLIS